MDLKIKGKNAFITGGTRGLGFASLKSLASEGVNIAYCSRSEEGIENVKKYLTNFDVKHFGFVHEINSNDKNINDFYNNSSIFITTSLWEGFPNSLTEAMHHGLACIGSNDSIAIKNLLDKDCGWLIYNFEENSFGQEIIKCIMNKDERLEKGTNARNKINEYRSEKIFKLWENLILSFA